MASHDQPLPLSQTDAESPTAGQCDNSQTRAGYVKPGRRRLKTRALASVNIGCGKSFDTLLMSSKMPCLLKKMHKCLISTITVYPTKFYATCDTCRNIWHHVYDSLRADAETRPSRLHQGCPIFVDDFFFFSSCSFSLKVPRTVSGQGCSLDICPSPRS